LGSSTIEGDSPVPGGFLLFVVYIPSTAEHVKFRRNLGGPSPKAKYMKRPIANKYREGKVKSISNREVK